MIPIIDLSKYPENSNQLIEACAEWGCFRLINHGVPLKMMSEMKSVARSLLDRPVEIKRQNLSGIVNTGYMAPTVTDPLYESLRLYEMNERQLVDVFCDQLECSSHQREIIQEYAKSMHNLVMDLATKIAESIGVIGDVFRGWPCLFRINKYNFKPESVGSLGLQLHRDTGFLTILQDDEIIGGLEVFDKSGKLAVVHPLPGSFFVNLGDVATVWSNERFWNVKHRVQCKEAPVRISIATFLLGPKDGDVEAPDNLIDSEHPRLYKPFSYQYYRKLRMANNLKLGEALAQFRASSLK